MTQTVTHIIQAMVLEGSKPAKHVASEIGKPYPTLLREINPFDNGAKIGVESLTPLMKAADSLKPLEYLAKQMGCALVPMKAECASSWKAATSALDALEQMGDLSKSLRRALVQGDVDQDDFDAIEKAAQNTASAAMTLVECLRLRMARDDFSVKTPLGSEQAVA